MDKSIDFCHLHVHSYYSLLDGLSSPESLAKTASEMGFKGLALTDHGSCGGLLSFQKACNEVKIKPILGCEFYSTADHRIQTKDSNTYHLILLAKNQEGIMNIMRLATKSEKYGKYKKPRVDFEMLASHNKGIICTTACSGGELPSKVLSEDKEGIKDFISRYKSIYDSDFYIEVMMHKYHESSKDQEEKEKKLCKLLYQLGKDNNIKVIATNDAHYARRDDAKYHDILLAMQTHDHIKNPKRFTFDGDEFYLRPYEEMLALYSNIPDVLSNTMEIYEKIEGNELLKKTTDLLPDFVLPSGYKNEASYLKDLVKDGMRSKNLIDKPEYRERIKFEMDNIIKCGYVKYFLILWDIINFAKRQKIRVGIGRGSCVGSLALYVLNITGLDPIKYGLLFERFINPDRISPPDVDVDFDYRRRDEIYQYIYDKYGQDHCAKIGTYNSFKAKAVIRYGTKALDLGKDWERYIAAKAVNPNVKLDVFKSSLELADRIAKEIPEGPNESIETVLKSSETFRSYMRKYPELLNAARHIEGTISSAGVHPAGIVICKNPIAEHLPLRESKGQICSQFDGPEVEELGLLKFDFLAIKTLTLIEDTVNLIKDRHGVEVDIDHLEPEDPKVFKLLNGEYPNMDNKGVFQFEKWGITRLLRNIHVDTFEDMIVANALYRPGPLGAGVHDLYSDYKHGRQKVKYLHPKMGEILKSTYGIMCFDKSQKIHIDNGLRTIGDVGKEQSVASFKDNGVLFSNPISNSFSNGTKDVFEYHLSNGFNILCTKNHKVLCKSGYNKTIWEEIDFAYNNKKPILYMVNDKLFNKEYDKKKAKICYLLGLLIGDGNLCNSSVVLCCGNNIEKANKIKKIYEECFDDGEGVIFFSTRCWYLRMINKSNKKKFGHNKNSYFKNFLSEIGVSGDFLEKNIPIEYFENNREYFCAFLAGYLDSDGNIANDIRFSSLNSNLLEQTCYILWNMGYHSYKSNHFLVVNDSERLWEEIKVYSLKNKTKRLSNGDCLKIESYVAKEILENKISENRISLRGFCKKFNLNRSTIMRILSLKNSYCKYKSLKKIIDKESLSKLSCLTIDNRVFLGKREVFDLSMQQNMDNNFFIFPGIIAHNCYQEDFMKVSQEIAGFTKGQSDTLRKVVGKKKPELIKKEHLDEKFLEGAKKNGVPENIAMEIFKQIEFFGGYGFNRSHAAAYSYVSYQTAFLKVYYPIEFMCNLLSSELDSGDKKGKMNDYYNEATRMKICIKHTDLNKSKLSFSIENGTSDITGENIDFIREPFTILDGLGNKAATEIVLKHPFSSLKDFLYRVDLSKVDVKIFETLVEKSCLPKTWTSMNKNRIMEQYHKIREELEKDKASQKKEKKYLSQFGGGLFDDFGNEEFSM